MNTRYITDDGEAGRFRALVSEIIYPSVSLPGQVFQPPYRHFCFYDYSHLQDSRCWQTLLQVAPDDALDVIFLDPDFSWLHEVPGNAYGVIRVDPGSTLEDLRHILESSPTREPLETFINLCPKCLLLPTSRVWALWADRAFDIAIAAFPDSRRRDAFIQRTPNWITLPTVFDALSFMIRDGDRLDNEFFREPMQRNYAQ
jgi:hypothetical protein